MTEGTDSVTRAGGSENMTPTAGTASQMQPLLCSTTRSLAPLSLLVSLCPAVRVKDGQRKKSGGGGGGEDRENGIPEPDDEDEGRHTQSVGMPLILQST